MFGPEKTRIPASGISKATCAINMGIVGFKRVQANDLERSALAIQDVKTTWLDFVTDCIVAIRSITKCSNHG